MKKYLMTGIAALALCVGFTSCSHDIETYTEDELKDLNAQKVLKTYEDAFKATFGTPAANKDWGFTATRTRGDYADANMWANDWIVPSQLTPAQRLRVTRYFQTHKYPGDQPNYGTKNFFVQQVYDGATNPITNLDGFSAPAYSTETYVPGNGEAINSGEHMDHLTAGPAVEGNGHHILNFNNSTYGTNGEPNHDVLNSTDVTYYEWAGWPKDSNYPNTHSDQIQLMLNHATYPWGYEDSSDSHLYTDCWTLVSAATIDAWADSDEAKALNIDLGDPVSTDGWNRDFIGFDFSLLVGDDIYEKVSYGSSENKKARYDEYMYDAIWGWDGENVVRIADSQTNGIFNYAEGFDGFLYNGTEKVNLLSSNLNNYCVDLIGFDNTTADNKVYHNEIAKEANYIEGAENDNCAYINNVKDAQGNIIKKQGLYGETTKFLNLKWLNKMLADGYLPVESKAMKLWGKPTGCRDGYYSDWIVSFMPATENKKVDDPTPDLRVIAEDLTVEANGDASDFDFNDVVFDVYYTTTNSAALVKVKAAGGTLPLRIAYVANPTSDEDYYEVHNLFAQANPGVNCAGKMINTNGTAETQSQNVRSRSLDNLEEPEAFPLEFTVSNAADAKNIIIEVDKGDGTGWVSLTAERGKAASKVAVGITFQWNDERQPMPESFKQYVTSNETTYDEWWRVNENEN